MPVIRLSAASLSAIVLSFGLLAGCASSPSVDEDPELRAEKEKVNDPWESTNRAVFDFNMEMDRRVLKPAAKAYGDYVPQYAQDRIHDLLNNLRAPLIFANDVLQGDVDAAVQTLMRFTFNTGFGALGLFDLAGEGGIPYHSNDLGATFGVWGVQEGPYMVLPVFGPSNPRDAVGMAGEFAADPIDLRLGAVGQSWAVYTRAASDGVDKRKEALAPLDDVERNAIDFYASVRALYRQHREAEIHHRGAGKQETLDPVEGTAIFQETN